MLYLSLRAYPACSRCLLISSICCILSQCRAISSSNWLPNGTLSPFAPCTSALIVFKTSALATLDSLDFFGVSDVFVLFGDFVFFIGADIGRWVGAGAVGFGAGFGCGVGFWACSIPCATVFCGASAACVFFGAGLGAASAFALNRKKRHDL